MKIITYNRKGLVVKFNVLFLTIFYILSLAVCSFGGVGNDVSQIPKWLAESETYGFAINNLDETIGKAWKFITHCSDSELFLREARLRGIRTFPYLTFYQFPMNATYKGIRLMEHADWILINKDNEWVRTGFWESEDSKNWYCVCCNVKEYADTIVSEVENLMKKGASGFFLDNIIVTQECYGDKFGRHKHMFPTQVEAFGDLLRRCREVVKRYDPEGAILINSANPPTVPKSYWQHIDCEMSESYICTWVADKRWGDWNKDWNGMDKKIPSGKQVCCLSYIGFTKNKLKDDLYFCYASARLMNFIWSSGYDSHAGLAGSSGRLSENPDVQAIYSLTVGQPTCKETVQNEIHYRMYDNGIIAVNPTDQERSIDIDRDLIPTYSLLDHYNGEYIDINGSRVKLSMPPQSGRVWLYKSSPDAIQKHQPPRQSYTLRVVTEPELGKTWFEIDGVPFITKSGRWTLEYEKGSEFGKFSIVFDKPGWHTVKVLDEEVKELLIPTSYGDAFKINQLDTPGAPSTERSSERLGKLMDPANPHELPSGKPYRFVGWSGASTSTDSEIKLYIDSNMTLTAKYVQDE